MKLRHGSSEEAGKSFLEGFDRLLEVSDKWMGAVVIVEPDNNLRIFRTTHNFPQERFLDAVALLRGNLIEELHGSLLPDAPLPRVAVPPPPPADLSEPVACEEVPKQDDVDSGELK